ncbi:MAG: MgtC/SapB family protein, partial [Lachnospiraceae bacterium]|nr:MgtC/SapB family protein [Lachnospiraceae bacterium]
NLFTKKKIKIASVHVERAETGMLLLKLYVKFPAGYQLGDVLRFLKETPEILSIDL